MVYDPQSFSLNDCLDPALPRVLSNSATASVLSSVSLLPLNNVTLHPLTQEGRALPALPSAQCT